MVRKDRSDGSIVLRSGYELPPCAGSTNEWLECWAAKTPDRVFLAQRSGLGWETLTYGEAIVRAKGLASGLLAREVSGPILILSGNSIDHALLTLAAQYVGLVTVPMAEQYSLIPTVRGRLKYVADLVQPDLVFAENASVYADALAVVGRPAIASATGDTEATPLHSMIGDPEAVALARAQVTPNTVANFCLLPGQHLIPKPSRQLNG